MKKRVMAWLTALCLLAGLAGCETSSIVKIGWVETKTGTAWKAKFRSCNGTETIRMDGLSGYNNQGAELLLSYDLSTESGALRVSVETKDGEELFCAQANGDSVSEQFVQIGVLPEGAALRLTAEQAKKGSFELHWDWMFD